MQELVGAWKLLFLNTTFGTSGSSYSANVLGRIIFTSDGYMNAMVTDPGKGLPQGASWSTASDKQIAAIARPIVAYSGPYQVQYKGDDMYTHVSVEISVDPSWVGTDQVRHASFSEQDGKSLLTLIPVMNGTLANSMLVWEKLEAPTLKML